MDLENQFCKCKQIYYSRTGFTLDKVYEHYPGCEESEDVKLYDSLPWYRKIFIENPRSNY